jgi:hypothetical protein
MLFWQKIRVPGVLDMKKFLLLLYVSVLFGCGGGSGGSSAPTPLGEGSFWAIDFAKSTSTSTVFYQTSATKVAEGAHCYIYVENDPSITVTQATINEIITQFNSTIYPDDIAAFGTEPNPGIDSNPKIYILLLNVKDGFVSGKSTSYIAGYFDPRNEYALSSQNPNSNQKEILFMNINPTAHIDPTKVDFFAILAHEFQHMIHWEQKTHQRGVTDETWLDEAMAQVARTYCGYGPDYASVRDYENDPNHSLVNFDETVGNYGMVYMWAQYFKDQFDPLASTNTNHTIFWEMLHNSSTGINEVNDTLATVKPSKNFTSAFRDWAMANLFGDGTNLAAPQGHPEWTYISINTWPGNYPNSVTLPGLFSTVNAPSLASLKPWSLCYYSYTPASGATTGTVTWTRGAASATEASFINGNPPASVTFDVTSGASNPFATIGYLIYKNPSSTSYTSSPPIDTVAHTAVTPVAAAMSSITSAASAPVAPQSPSEVLAAMDMSPAVRRYVQDTGKPHHAFVDSWFQEKEKALRAQGIRPPF